MYRDTTDRNGRRIIADRLCNPRDNLRRYMCTVAALPVIPACDIQVTARRVAFSVYIGISLHFAIYDVASSTIRSSPTHLHAISRLAEVSYEGDWGSPQFCAVGSYVCK